MRDRKTRSSKGVGFVLFKTTECALKAAEEMNDTIVMGRTIKCSVAIDNGRSSEFSQRRVYADKSRCYECGVRINCYLPVQNIHGICQDEGHLSYNCPKNTLGDRQPPPKKRRKRTQLPKVFSQTKERDVGSDDKEDVSSAEDERLERIALQASFNSNAPTGRLPNVRRRQKPGYFSDEDAED